jgi:hypothetical protein
MKSHFNVFCVGILISAFLFSGKVTAQCLSGNCKDGFGVKLYPDSSKFEGVFFEGTRKQGKYLYKNGDVYEGSFDQNSRNGYGVYKGKNGQVFHGIYENDNKVYGRLEYQNGDVYIGGFNDNKPEGYGIMSLHSGEQIEGMWQNGKPDWTISPDSASHISLDTSEVYIPQSTGSKAIAPKVYAVVVGIADYAGSSSDLNYSDDDARLFDSQLKRVFQKEIAAGESRLLLNANATKANILGALNAVFSKATENDYIIFFFSGHGSPGSLVPHDLSTNRIPHSDIKEIFKKSKAKYRLCIEDACFAGSVGDQNISGNDLNAVQSLQDARLAVFLSSTNQEYSIELSELQQGLFTYCLINGMKGAADINKDKYITAGELFIYARKTVEAKSKGKQKPVIIGQNLNKIPICRLK